MKPKAEPKKHTQDAPFMYVATLTPVQPPPMYVNIPGMDNPPMPPQACSELRAASAHQRSHSSAQRSVPHSPPRRFVRRKRIIPNRRSFPDRVQRGTSLHPKVHCFDEAGSQEFWSLYPSSSVIFLDTLVFAKEKEGPGNLIMYDS